MLNCPSTCFLLRARAMGGLLSAIGKLSHTLPSRSQAFLENTHQLISSLLICQLFEGAGSSSLHACRTNPVPCRQHCQPHELPLPHQLVV